MFSRQVTSEVIAQLLVHLENQRLAIDAFVDQNPLPKDFYDRCQNLKLISDSLLDRRSDLEPSAWVDEVIRFLVEVVKLIDCYESILRHE